MALQHPAESSRRILVLGATGHFGSRISRRLAARRGIRLILSSRSEARAIALAEELRDADVEAVCLDQSADEFPKRLGSIAPDIVIHTAGPYQGQDYSVAMACIDAGCHYVDLADGRAFVSGIDALDTTAKRANVAVISGASTLPTLPAAVVDAMRDDFRRIGSVRICIAPAHRTPRGPGTARAVLSYCGRPFDVPIRGRLRRRYGWQNLRFFQMPGTGLRLRAACDVPDYDILPQYAEGLDTVEFHAALEAPWEHIALWTMAALTRLGLVRDWGRFADRFIAAGNRLQFLGSTTGGMRVRLDGLSREGRPLRKEWRLVARRNHGPEIPCTPSIVVMDKLLTGAIRPGARPCVGLMTLGEFEAAMQAFDIQFTVFSREG